MKLEFLVAVIFFVSMHANLPAQTPRQVKEMAYADSARLVAIYKDLHQNPELSFTETRTAGIVAKDLKDLGYEVTTGIAKTGVAGVFKNGQGPVVMFRADMDGLPVKEQTDLPYASTKTVVKDDGAEAAVMHACGHDAHVTWLLGVARIIMAVKKQWHGTVVFIAQPAEEVGQGAKAMIDDRLYERGIPQPDYLFGMHTWPIALGTIQNGFDERFAGTDQLDVLFKGIGGHGSSPELTKDPIVMASTAVMQYQAIISRVIAPQETAVITVGSFQAGSVNNIIPPTALLKLNLRWFSEKTRTTLMENIRRVNEGIALANGLPEELYPTLIMKATISPLINNNELVRKVNLALEKVMPADDILTNTPAVMVSEDFHYLASPGSKTVCDFVMVGVANREAARKAAEEGRKYPFFNHNGNYRVELAAIPLGTLIGATAVLELLRK